VGWLRRLLGLGGRPEGWSMSVGTEKGQTVIVRTRSSSPAGWPARPYPASIELLWQYDGTETNGMPSTELNIAMTDFEDAVAALEQPELGFHGLTITGNGRREWLWYVADPVLFTERALALVANRYPVQVRTAAAP
jgi:hypothetical protein